MSQLQKSCILQSLYALGKCLEHSCQAKLQPGCRLGKDHAGTTRNESAQGPIVYCYHGNQADRSATQNMLPLIARMLRASCKLGKYLLCNYVTYHEIIYARVCNYAICN